MKRRKSPSKANLTDLLKEEDMRPGKKLHPIQDDGNSVRARRGSLTADDITGNDAWAKRPQAWSRLLTLDRQERIFDQTAWEAMQQHNPNETLSSTSSSRHGGSGLQSSCSSLRAQTTTPSCPGSARTHQPASRSGSYPSPPSSAPHTSRQNWQRGRRRGRQGLPEVAPGWSLRYCELAGVARDPHHQGIKRRGALTALPSPRELLAQFDGKEPTDSSVFLANRGFDLRLAKFQDKEGRESRLKARRHAILHFGVSRMHVAVANKMMHKKDPDRMSHLMRVCETKVNKDGTVQPVELKAIPKDRMHTLCTKHAMPETEVASMFETFNHYDFDSSGALSIDEVRNVLADMGLQPMNRDEKAEVAECITDMQKAAGEDLDFEHFMELLKTVKDRLRQVQSIHCMHLFHEADVDQSEGLDLSEVLQILENKMGLQPHSQEEHNEINNVFRDSDGDGDGFLDLEDFQTFIQKVRSKILTMRRKEEMTIAKCFDLDPEILHEFRSDLPMLWGVFRQYSFANTDKGVHKDYLLALLVETGICILDSEDEAFKTVERTIEQQAKTHNGFPHVLSIIRESRRRAMASMEEELTTQFHTYDRDKSGTLSMSEIYQTLEEFKMLPRSREEQQEVGRVLDHIDRDGSGFFDLGEFHSFFQKMTAQVRLSERRREQKAAADLGIGDDRYPHLRRNFMALQPTDEGTVQQISVIQTMTLLRELLDCKNIEEDDLRVYTRQVQQAPEVPIDFSHYLGVVKTVILDKIIEPDKDEDELEGRASPTKGDKKKTKEKVPSSPSARATQ